ncbi:hypothetical protein BU225_20075 [Stenotrophomonas sp. MB339]|uniref:hypothetical protein n=1 Tax=Stenotrophomonas sp. MB339 TaxID=1663558 RepID=UPI0009759A2C|nr:hypothetical protein [Stenotrophomonas sp. MB339]OMO39192.1 hypothetical protein BU225_20075 [Stenotrophomonas sp. MB339]
MCRAPSRPYRPSFRLTSLAAGLWLAATATAQPVFDRPATATFKGDVVSRGENVVPGSAAGNHVLTA